MGFSNGFRRRLASMTAIGLSLLVVPWASWAGPAALHVERVGVIRTTPFVGTDISMGDGEGSAYVRRDRSLWLADDNTNAIYAVNPRTGKLKRVIRQAAFRSAHRAGGGPRAGVNRSEDFESVAYDEARDALYVFSGVCCDGKARPTVFRLTRRGGVLRVASWQPLPGASDFSAAGWNAGDGRVYVAMKGEIRSYVWARNALGSPFGVTGLSGITGLGFSRDGSRMFVVNHLNNLYAVDWDTKTIASGWTFDLAGVGIRDARAVDRIGGHVFILDGGDRPGSALEHAVFELKVVR
ncbi:MAG: hypothetical protein ACE14W_05220 [Candidatus Velamenicoccus archaeovorus]